MKRILFAFAALALFLPATAQITKAAEVSVDFFYNNLSGGDWIETDDYGYVWQPSVAVSNTSWRPYADGYWAYTDLGWTWVSYEDFGWATYHYGRWSRLTDYGWVWVPGRDEDMEWGPAWVSWRTGGEYIGWAPLPPGGERIYEGRSIGGHVDVEFDIGPSYYNFVDVRYIGEPVLRERIVDVNQNVTYINQTVNVTNITYKNKVVYNYGPDITIINQHASRPIQRLKIERQDNVDVSVAVKSGGLMKPQGDKLIVAAPMHIRKAESQAKPQAIKTKIEKGKIDKGWASVDANTQTQMKQKFKTEEAKNAQIGAGAGANANAAAGASPVAGATAGSAAAATSPMPNEKGKGKHGNRSAESAETKAAAGAGTSPVAGTSPIGAASPNESTTMEHGRQRGKHADQNQPNSSASDGANAGAEATGSPAGAATENDVRGGGKHRGREKIEQERVNAGASPNDLSTNQDQGLGSGKNKGRRLEQPAGATGPTGQGEASSPAGAGTSDLQGTPGGAGGKHRGERAMGQPEGAAGPSGQGEGQGKREGGKKNKAEPAGSPAPSPQ